MSTRWQLLLALLIELSWANLASEDIPPELSGYDLLGEGSCQGDILYRTVNYMSTSIAEGEENFLNKSTGCAELCSKSASLLDRCMGFQVSTDGKCLLFDQDWTVAEKDMAEARLSNATKVALSAGGVQSFPGRHLLRLYNDSYVLASLTFKPACYRRQIDCESAPDCTAFHRYPCSLGKKRNTCETCLPGYTGNPNAANEPCTPAIRTPPTLRLAFASGAFITDSHGNSDGLNTAYLGAAFSIKYAWENNYSWLKTPLVPPELQQRFNIEFYSFTENITLFTSLDQNGTQQVSPGSVRPGLRAIAGVSGGSYGDTLQLREAPPDTRIHAVIGSQAGDLSKEEALLRMAGKFQTPILGWEYVEPDLKSPFYIRTNRVALNAGSAIAKILQIIGYDTLSVMQQVEKPQVSDQLMRVMGPSAQITVYSPAKDARGGCDGSDTKCLKAIPEIWNKVREADARVIVHEHGGEAFEFVLMMLNDLFGPKTVYIQTGHPCSYIDFYDTIAWAEAYHRAMTEANLTECTICPNIIQYLGVSDEDRKNWTFVAKYLFSDENPYRSYQTSWCPQFPTVEDLLNCDYCDGLSGVFASPGCEGLQKRFEMAMSRTMCVEPDLAENIEIRESYQVLFDCLDVDKDSCLDNMTAAGLNNSQKLRATGIPSSYLEDYEPGGRLWQKGLETELERPFGYSAAWTDIDLCNALGITCWVNNLKGDVVDAILTAIVGYNEFVRSGGDSDHASDATAPPTSERQGNSVASGWRQFLLNTDFDGFRGRVQYVPEGMDVGERNIKYKVYQIMPGTPEGCFLRTESSNASMDGLRYRFVSSTWNFKYVPIQKDLSGELKLTPEDNEVGCKAFPAGWFAGKMAFIKRGGCYFGTKLKHALESGAVGMLMLNVASDMPVFMSADDPTLTISGVCIGKSDGLPIWDAVKYGSTISVKLEAATNCVDPEYSVTKGLTVYLLGMSYDLATNEVRDNNGDLVKCSGVPGDDLANCSGILFHDGTATGPGSAKPPRQEREVCGNGYEYSLALRECSACPSGRYRVADASERCLSCLAGTFASGLANSECERCQSGTYSLSVAANCTICAAGSSSSSGSDKCDPCEAGYFTAQQGSSRCSMCQAGSFSSEASDRCTLCLPGNFSAIGSAKCEECDAGYFSSLSGQSECIICQPGSYSLKAAGNCTLCHPGKYVETKGADTCLDCTVGRFSSLPGLQTTCTPCKKGSYSASAASTACTRCIGELTTPGVGQQMETDCVCKADFYREVDDKNGECKPCPRAMQCPIGSDIGNLNKVISMAVSPSAYLSLTEQEREERYGAFPQLDSGYMSLPSRPLWVYMCQSEKACPGGMPDSCGPQMKDIACGVCEDGYHRGDNSCIECSSIETSKFLFPILPLTFGPLFIFLLYVKVQDPINLWGSPTNGLLICSFILLYHCQTISVISIFNLLYPKVVGDTWKHTDFLLKGLTILRTDCAGITSFEATFITNMMLPIFLAALFCVTWVMNWMFCLCFKSTSDEDMANREDHKAVSTRMPSQNTLTNVQKTPFLRRLLFHATRPINPNIFFSTYGTLVFSFSISIASISFSLFKCYSHPNGEDRSLFSAPEVLCGEEQWNRMVGIAVAGILLYCVFPLCYTSKILWQAPARFADMGFRQRWKFLISKFRPEIWWWGNMTIIKGILLQLSIVSFEKGIEQIWWTSLILLIFSLLTIFAQPWRHIYANVVDMISNCSLATAVGLTCWFAPPPENDEESKNHGVGVVFITILPFVGFTWYLWTAIRAICNKAQYQAEKLVLGYRLRTIFQAYLETSPADMHRFCMRLTEHDMDTLSAAYAIISAEMFAKAANISKAPRLIAAYATTGDCAKMRVSDLNTQEPWAGIERWDTPKCQEVEAAGHIQQLSKSSSTLFHEGMSKTDFESVVKSELHINSGQAAAMFSVMDIHATKHVQPEDVRAVMTAYGHQAVLRYGQTKSIPKAAPMTAVHSSDSNKVDSTSEKASTDVKSELVEVVKQVPWEDITNEMNALCPAPRGKIHSLRSPRRPEPLAVKQGATTPPVVSPRADQMRSERSSSHNASFRERERMLRR